MCFCLTFLHITFRKQITGRILAGTYSKGMVNFANGQNKFNLQYPNLVEDKYFSIWVICESLSGQMGD